MTVTGQLREMLIAVAKALGQDLRERLVFVGGCTTALFISDPIVLEEVRFTDDVDLIVDLAGHAAWGRLQETLRERGFKVSPEDEIICRMRLGPLKVDFMPDDERILGFSNQWYRRGIENAETSVLADGLSIRRLTPPIFLATKLEAWLGRGRGDLFTSRDLEDILLVVDGRPQLVEEVKAAEDEVREYIARQIVDLMKMPGFEDFLDGNIRGPEGRVGIVADRLRALSQAAG